MTKCPQCGKRYGKRRRCYFCNGRPKIGEDRECERCCKVFYVAAWQIEKFAGGGTYCSRRCTNAGLRGRKFRLAHPEIRRYTALTGYVLVKVGIHEWRAEHRVKIEKKLGRQLTRDETVHHINGIKTDNRLRNLLVLSNSEHQKLHAREGSGPHFRRSKR